MVIGHVLFQWSSYSKRCGCFSQYVRFYADKLRMPTRRVGLTAMQQTIIAPLGPNDTD